MFKLAKKSASKPAAKPATKPAPKPMSESAKQIRDRQEYEEMPDGDVRRGTKKK